MSGAQEYREGQCVRLSWENGTVLYGTLSRTAGSCSAGDLVVMAGSIVLMKVGRPTWNSATIAVARMDEPQHYGDMVIAGSTLRCVYVRLRDGKWMSLDAPAEIGAWVHLHDPEPFTPGGAS